MIFMKKLIAIAVVFVLAGGAVFAADIQATATGKVTPIQGTSKDGDIPQAGGSLGNVRIQASGQDEDGVFGGFIRFEKMWGTSSATVAIKDLDEATEKYLDGDDKADSAVSVSNSIEARGLIWWKPLDILKVQIGYDDGTFGASDGGFGWGFYEGALAAEEKWQSGGGYVGAGGLGLWLSLTPIEPLTIDVLVPFISDAGEAKNVYKKMDAGVTYNLPIGSVGIYYNGDLNELSDKSTASASKLGAAFKLTAVENLTINLGVAYPLPVKSDKIGDVNLGEKYGQKAGDTTVTVSNPVAMSFGVGFKTGALGIKARLMGEFGGNSKGEGKGAKLYSTWDKDGNEVPLSTDIEKKNVRFLADLMPYFAINDSVTANLSTGLDMTKPDGKNSVVAWHINPYVNVKGHFYAGVRIDSDGTGDKIVNWSVPLGLTFGF
jgi:hypothetical protein